MMSWRKNVRDAQAALDNANAALEKDDDRRQRTGIPFDDDARYHQLNDAANAARQQLRDAILGRGGR